MGILGITPALLRKKLNPKADPNCFSYGDGFDISESDVLTSIEETVDYVLSRIPAIYSRVIRHNPGEVLVRCAADGQGTAVLGLSGPENVKLYRNYHGPWSARCAEDAMDAAEYAVNGVTRVVTFTPVLMRGDSVYAEYDHSAAASCPALQRICLNLLAAEWARRLQYSTEQFEIYRDWETQAYSDLKRMHEKGEGRLGIDMFDKLELVNETKSASRTLKLNQPDW